MLTHKLNYAALCMTLTTLYFGFSEAVETQPLLERGAFAETQAAIQGIEREGYRAQMLSTYFTLVGRQDLVFEIEESLPLPRRFAAPAAK